MMLVLLAAPMERLDDRAFRGWKRSCLRAEALALRGPNPAANLFAKGSK